MPPPRWHDGSTRLSFARGSVGQKALWPGRVLLVRAAWAVSTSFNCTAGPKDEACCGVPTRCADTLKELQKKNKQLRAQLSQSRWPGLKCFFSDGQIYSLPLRATKRNCSHRPAEGRLAYLAGFLDGDGCVSGSLLKVSQSFDQAEVLMLFRKTFGGSIAYEHVGMGLSKPALQWRACGQSARRAAELLAPHSITKQKQLLLVALWHIATPEQRENLKSELRRLKDYDSAVTGPCSWEYCAGFFDAEGCITQPYAGASLVLEIVQKHPRVLKCIRSFLADTLSIRARVRKRKDNLHVLFVCGLDNCKQILQRLLDAGLLCKAKSAQLAANLTPENAMQVNTELRRLAGNQRFGKRLDAAGRQRAQKINSIRKLVARLKRKGQPAEAEAKLVEVESLKQEHDLLKAGHENQQLLEYICKLQSLHDNSWEGPLPCGM